MGWANKNYQPGFEFNNIGTAVRPNDGYLYTQGSANNNYGNLIIGTTSTNTSLKFIVGGGSSANIVATMTSKGLVLNTQSYLVFGDGTIQTTAALPSSYETAAYAQANSANVLAQSAYNQANTALANTIYLQGGLNSANANISLLFAIDNAQNTYAQSVNTYAQSVNTYAYSAYAQANSASSNTIYLQGGLNSANANISLLFNYSLAANANASALNTYSTSAYAQANTALANTIYLQGVTVCQNTNIQSAWNLANTAVQNTAVIQLQTVSLSGNLIANTPGQSIFVDRFTSNSATFNQNLVVLGNLTANTLLGNVFFSNVVTTTSQSNSILWTTQAGAIAQQTAQLWYYSNTQSLILDTDIPGDRLSISKVLFFRAFNATGATIPANSFVRLVSGVTPNQIPYIALADATNSANATVAGFVKNSIANSAYGFAYSQGIVEDLNTTGLGANGDILFLSTTPGIASNVAPISGNSNTVVQLGRVILRDSSLGKLFIQNQLRQAYGRTNGSLLYAYANNITSSNTVSVNDSTQTLTSNNIVANTITVANEFVSGNISANTIIANTFVYGSATANGMVTQLTSKSTTVTSNGITGQITTHNAALAGQAYVTFTVNNSYVKHTNDIIIVNVQNSVTTPNPYLVGVSNVSVGSFNVTIYNADSGGGSSHSDAIVLNYAVMRVGN
jgi:hypothetical protein